MSDDINAQLLDAVRLLTERIDSLESEVKGIKLLNAQNVPEETAVAIAAAAPASPKWRRDSAAGPTAQAAARPLRRSPNARWRSRARRARSTGSSSIPRRALARQC